MNVTRVFQDAGTSKKRRMIDCSSSSVEEERGGISIISSKDNLGQILEKHFSFSSEILKQATQECGISFTEIMQTEFR